MAQATTARGVKLLVKIGDGADPEVFAHPCLINAARGLDIVAQTNDIVIPDCSDPDLMAWAAREKVSLSGTINGQGVLHTPDTETWSDYVMSADPKNVRVELGGVALADGGGYWAGSFLCTQFGVTGERGNRIEASVTMLSDGAITWTDAAA